MIGDNQPYFVSDETDYTIPRHAEARGLPHVEIELRQDLVGDEAGQDEWAWRLTEVLREAENVFSWKPTMTHPSSREFPSSPRIPRC